MSGHCASTKSYTCVTLWGIDVMTFVEHLYTEHYDVCYSCVVCCNLCVSCIMLKYIVDRCPASASPGERYI